jgi:hypothetical protein
MCDPSSQAGHKGKGREYGDRGGGEWIVNVHDMDSGLEEYGSKDRVILVLGGKPFSLIYDATMLMKRYLLLRYAVNHKERHYLVGELLEYSVHLRIQ